MTRPSEIRAGSRWRKVLLDTEAVYTVLEVEADHVTVEVEHAPGLAPGTRFRLTIDSVAAMAPLDDAEPAPAQEIVAERAGLAANDTAIHGPFTEG